MKTRSRNRLPYRSHDREICGSWGLEEILYEFAGWPHIITLDSIERAVSRFPDSAPAEEVVDALIDGMFCGMEIAPVNLRTSVTKPTDSSCSRCLDVYASRRE